MIKTVPIGWAWRPLLRSTVLGQAVIAKPPPALPPQPAWTSRETTVAVIGGLAITAVVLYAIFGHDKMKWDKFFY